MKECKIVAAKGFKVIGKEKLESFFTYSDEVKYRVITKEVDGYDVTIPNEMGSTTSWVEHLSQAFDMIGKYDNEYLAIEKRAQELGNYLSSDEGAWGR